MKSFTDESLPICERDLEDENVVILANRKYVPSARAYMNFCYLFQVYIKSLLYDVVKWRVEYFNSTILCSSDNGRYVPLAVEPLQFHYSKTHRIYFLGLLFLQPEIPHNIFIHLLPASEKRFRTALIYARSVFGIGLGPFPALPFLIF